MRNSGSSIKGLRAGGLPSPFWALLTTQFRVEFGMRGLSEKLGLGRRARNAWLYLGLLALAFFPLMGMLYQMGDNIAAQSIMIGQPGLPVIVAVMMGQFLVFFIGISSVMSTLYYASDLESLVAMPLTGRQILGAKVLVAYAAQLAFSSVLTVPFLVPLGLRLGSAAFWPLAVLVNLVIPAIPLTLGLLTTVLIMRVTKGMRHRDMLRVALGLVFFVVIIGFQYLNTNMMTKGPEEVMRALMEPNGLVQVVAGHYPPLKWAAWALTGWSSGTGFLGTVAFIGGSLAVLLLVLTMTEGWFMGGLGSDVRTAGRSREVTGTAGHRTHSRPAAGAGASRGAAAEVARAGGERIDLPTGLFRRQRDPSAAIGLRDHWVLTRTPNFLLVVLTNMAVVPILWLLGVVGGGDLRALIGGAAGFPMDLVVLIFALVQGALASMNQVSSTSISREGPAFWLSKMIPVPARVQVRAKLKYSLVMSAIQLSTLVVVAVILLRPDAYHLTAAAILGMLASWPVSVLCIANDLHSPRLSWTEPHQAMKGNIATLGAMLLSAGYLLVCSIAVGFIRRLGLAGVPLYLVVAGIAVGSGFLLQRYVENMAGKRYQAIEV